MDVRCEKCQTVYEFDDAKVTAAGVTVKCTQCGNLFRVRKRTQGVTNPSLASPAKPAPPPTPETSERQRTSTLPRGTPASTPPPRPPTPARGIPPVAAPRSPTPARGVPPVAGSRTPTPGRGVPTSQPPPAAGDDRVWLVRLSSTGEVKRFRELTTLQQWIVEKRVTRDDEISRSGDTWKRLGGIAELASFFHVVEQAEVRAQQTQAAGPEDLALTTTAQMTVPASSSPPPVSFSGSAPTVNQRQSSERAFATTSPAIAPLSEPPRPALASDEDDELDQVPRSGIRPAKLVAVATVLVLVGVAGYLAAFKREALKGLFAGEEGRGREAYKKGREYFLLDSDDSLRLADQQLQRAHGANETNAQPVAALAEVNAHWGACLRDDAKAAEVKQPARAEDLRKQAQSHLDDAKRYANEAATLAPDDPDVNRAMAAFLLVDGAPAPQVEGFLNRAEAKRADDPDTAYVRGALLYREGRLAEARTRLEQANQINQTKTQHDLLRANLLLAEIAAAQGRRDEARQLARKILEINSHHDRARALIAALEAVPAPSDAGAAPAPPPPESPPPAASPPKGEKPPKGEARGEPKGGDVDEAMPRGGFEGLLAQGNRLLENGKTKEAQKAFEKALALQPSNVEALNGLGYCHLDTEHFVAAIDRFKQSLSTAPKNGDAILGIAEAYKMRGDKPHALEYYKKYANELPSGSKIRMAQTNIRELERTLGAAEAPKAGPVHDAPPVDNKEKEPSEPPPPPP